MHLKPQSASNKISAAIRAAIFFMLFTHVSTILCAQKFEFSAGVNKNKYFDSMKDDHFESDYHPGYSYSIGIHLADIKTDVLPLRLSLLIEHYKGEFRTTSFGLSGSNTTKADVAKTTIGIAAYPLNFTLLKHIQLGIGGEISFRIQQKTSGFQSGWHRSYPTYTTFNIPLDGDSVNIHHTAFFGVVGRLGYEISVNKKWSIVPQYRFYVGLTEEFKNIEAPVYSMRHSIEIGVARKIK